MLRAVPSALLLAAAPLAAQDIAFVQMDTAYYRDCSPRDTLPGVCRVRRPWTVAALRERMRGGPVWAHGDTLTAVYVGAARRVLFCCGATMPMSPIGDDLWVVSVRVPDLPRARLHLRVQLNDSAFIPLTVWHGPGVRPPVVPAKRLGGRLIEDTIASTATGTRRAFSVYLPPWGNSTRRPVVYLADGPFVPEVAALVDTLIRSGRLAPVALVGVHTATRPDPAQLTMRTDPRFFEYLTMEDPRYLAHERLFTEEAPRWAERRFGVSAAPADRAIWGVSNSGYFVLNMGIRHPGLWGHILGFSPAGDHPALGDVRAGAAAPAFRVVGGSLEPLLFRPFAAAWERDLRTAGFTVRRTEYIGGHEQLPWKEEFADVLIEIFGRGTPPRR